MPCPVYRGVLSLAVVALCVFPPSLSAQAPPEIDKLAARVAERVAKTHARHILVATLEDCMLDTQLCTTSDDALHSALGKVVPSVQFTSRGDVVGLLKGHGLLALDAYNGDVLEAVASEAGAEILITEKLRWVRDGYELTSEITDAAKRKKLDAFKAKIARPARDSGEEPVVFKDPETKLSLIIPKSHRRRFPVFRYPECEKCPQPAFTPEGIARRLQGTVFILVTITEQGVAEHIGVVKGFDEGMNSQAIQAVRGWRFKPAIGLDGKPFATRTPIQVIFRIE